MALAEEEPMYPAIPPSLPPKRQFGLRLQLMVAFGLLSVLVAAVSGTALWGLFSVRESARQAVAVDGQLSRLASKVATQTLESRRYEKDFFLNIGDLSARDDYLAKWRANRTALEQAIAAFDAAATIPEDKQQAAQWREQVSSYERDVEQIVSGVADGRITTSVGANEA